MLRDVYLFGEPGKLFGRHFRIAVNSPHEAIRAIETLRPGARQYFRRGYWRLIVGKPRLRNFTTFIDMHLGNQPLFLVPATRAHGGGGGAGKAILGAVVIAAAIIASPFTGGGSLAAAMAASPALFGAGLGITYGTIAMMGVSMVAAGVTQMLSAPPQTQQQGLQQSTDYARAEDRPSFMFNGVVNNTQQGGPVPLVFGLHMVGSVVILGSLNAEDIPV